MHKTFLSFIMICITSLLYGEIEYGFSALNIGGGFIIFEPFDICGNTPNLIIPSTCSSFGNIMGMTGKLTLSGKIFVIMLMIIGRLGPFTILLFLLGREKPGQLKYPVERIIIG